MLKNKYTKKAFTLIELLVVITIIGILATGAVSVYTSQIQKARDSNRINDIKALQSGVEQFYQDVSEYPTGDDFGSGGTNSSGDNVPGVQTYVPKLPVDPKSKQSCNGGSMCGYVYMTGPDDNTIALQEYEISTAFENAGNVASKAANTKDKGNDNNRYEIGIDIANNNTKKVYVNNYNPSTATDSDTSLFIEGAAFKLN